jgi:hypothetical protein
MIRAVAAVTLVAPMIVAPPASATVTPSCWGILSAVQAHGEIAWLHQCTASLRGERPVVAVKRCQSWLDACRRNPFSGGRPGIITY